MTDLIMEEVKRLNKFISICNAGFEEPELHLPYEKLAEDDYQIVKKYPGGKEKGITFVIVEPFAGHTGLSDHGPGQSLVQTLQSIDGVNDVIVNVWKEYKKDHGVETIDNLVKRVVFTSSFVDEKFIIMGLCMGGWVSAIFASIFNNKLLGVITNGSPIDFTAGGGYIQENVQKTPEYMFDVILKIFGGKIPGEFMLNNWKMMHWYNAYIGDFIDYWFLSKDADDKTIEKIKTFRRWWENSIDIGPWWPQACKELFCKNMLLNRLLKIFGNLVDMKRVNKPWLRLWGTEDDITLKEQAFFPKESISTPDNLIFDQEIEGVGHIGGFISSKAQKTIKKSIKKFIITCLKMK